MNICTDDNTVMKFVKLSNKATTPMRGSKHAAGIDLFSAERKEISPGGRRLIKTDIAIMIPMLVQRQGQALQQRMEFMWELVSWILIITEMSLLCFSTIPTITLVWSLACAYVN